MDEKQTKRQKREEEIITSLPFSGKTGFEFFDEEPISLFLSNERDYCNEITDGKQYACTFCNQLLDEIMYFCYDCSSTTRDYFCIDCVNECQDCHILLCNRCDEITVCEFCNEILRCPQNYMEAYMCEANDCTNECCKDCLFACDKCHKKSLCETCTEKEKCKRCDVYYCKNCKSDCYSCNEQFCMDCLEEHYFDSHGRSEG
jgi:hypothetical protein